ncbi:ferrous iron transport protein A [Celerinatantimonas sp. YJH-8]|uniref:FeoA family protein n=1 Tax=Celerinatantimonas sp. YJH-8 TaxID=3228714 RepID=UPI0038BE48C5
MSKATTPQIFQLSQLHLGESVIVNHIDADIEDVQRMNMLGIRKGIQMKIVHGPGRRGAVVQIGGARVALGPEIILQIAVTQLAQPISENTLVAGRSI